MINLGAMLAIVAADIITADMLKIWFLQGTKRLDDIYDFKPNQVVKFVFVIQACFRSPIPKYSFEIFN